MKKQIEIDRWQDLRVGDEIECGGITFKTFDPTPDSHADGMILAASCWPIPRWVAVEIIDVLILQGTVSREIPEPNTDLVNLILSHGTENDGTSWPYWAICKRTPRTSEIVLVQGIWFNRQDAQAHLNSRLYEYGKSVFVYCFSGYHSDHLRRLYELAGSRGHA